MRPGNSNSLVNNCVVLQASARVVAVRTTGRTPNSVMTEPSRLLRSVLFHFRESENQLEFD